MVITSNGGVKVATRGRTTITFEKINKRWYVCYQMKGTKGGGLLRVPVKHTRMIKAGTL